MAESCLSTNDVHEVIDDASFASHDEVKISQTNIEINDQYKLIPADGIYAVEVEHKGKSYKGMMSIGMNPTVNGTKKTIEVKIFDFNADIYNERIRVYFKQRIRDEVKFENLDALQKQLMSDKEKSLQLLNS